MSVAAPHYLLFSQSNETVEPGRWRFVLRAADGSEGVVADDVDPDARGERLELLTVVRGLEALDQPSEVTLMTPSTYIREGIRYGLCEWRENGWRWECFGQMVPVKDSDLWRRVDRALAFHRVECRTWRLDPPHRVPSPLVSPVGRADGSPTREVSPQTSEQPTRPSISEGGSPIFAARKSGQSPSCLSGVPRCRNRIAERLLRWKRRLAGAWAALVSCPWFG